MTAKTTAAAIDIANDLMDNHMDRIHASEGYQQLIAKGIPAAAAETILVCMLSMCDVVARDL
jgi:hypothetical protein